MAIDTCQDSDGEPIPFQTPISHLHNRNTNALLPMIIHLASTFVTSETALELCPLTIIATTDAEPFVLQCLRAVFGDGRFNGYAFEPGDLHMARVFKCSKHDKMTTIHANNLLYRNIEAITVDVVAWDEPTTCYYFGHLIGVSEFLHENSVCHRDLRITSFSLLYSCYLGLRGIVNKKDHLFTATLGSTNCAAPKVLEYDGQKADIWSCGVISYCFSGKVLPLDEPDNYQLLFQRISTVETRHPSKFSHNVVELLNKIVEREPKRRYTVEPIHSHAFMKENGKMKVTRRSSTILMTYNRHKGYLYFNW